MKKAKLESILKNALEGIYEEIWRTNIRLTELEITEWCKKHNKSVRESKNENCLLPLPDPKNVCVKPTGVYYGEIKNVAFCYNLNSQLDNITYMTEDIKKYLDEINRGEILIKRKTESFHKQASMQKQETELKELPAKWCVEYNVNQRYIIKDFLKCDVLHTDQGYLHQYPDNDYCICGSKPNGYTEISFADFERLVLKKEQDKEQTVTLEVGEWYKDIGGTSVVCITKIPDADNENFGGYGLDNGVWFNDNNIKNENIWLPCDLDYVREALTEYANPIYGDGGYYIAGSAGDWDFGKLFIPLMRNGIWLNEAKEETFVNLEIRRWYNGVDIKSIFYTSEQRDNDSFNVYGLFGEQKEWRNDIACFKDAENAWTHATDEEVEKALIEEAKRRGFKEGVKVNRSMFKTIISNNIIIEGDKFRYFPSEDVLEMGLNTIYNKGIWATIVEQPKEIDWSVPMVVTNEAKTIFILTNGSYTEQTFAGVTIKSEDSVTKKGETWLKWSKDYFKPITEPITINND